MKINMTLFLNQRVDYAEHHRGVITPCAALKTAAVAIGHDLLIVMQAARICVRYFSGGHEFRT